MPSHETQVFIVGGGPVGLSLAADLGSRGIACILVEQGDGTIYHPRANTVNSRTMEFCRRWGVADEVHNSGAPPDFPSTIQETKRYLEDFDRLQKTATSDHELFDQMTELYPHWVANQSWLMFGFPGA